MLDIHLRKILIGVFLHCAAERRGKMNEAIGRRRRWRRRGEQRANFEFGSQ